MPSLIPVVLGGCADCSLMPVSSSGAVGWFLKRDHAAVHAVGHISLAAFRLVEGIKPISYFITPALLADSRVTNRFYLPGAGAWQEEADRLR